MHPDFITMLLPFNMLSSRFVFTADLCKAKLCLTKINENPVRNKKEINNNIFLKDVKDIKNICIKF
jgi:hypothetical protein